jgi:kumamolisin
MKPPTRLGSRRHVAYLAAAAAGSLALFGLAAPATAATHSHPAKVHVPQGAGPSALKGLSVFGPTPADTPETVSFVLRARNLGTLEGRVLAGMPGGYLSVGQFAHRYGQPGRNIAALEHYLAGYGIATTSDADGLDVTATGTAGEFDNALTVQQRQYKTRATRAFAGGPVRPGRMIHGTLQEPLLPYSLAHFVLSILGLDNYPSFASSAAHTLPLASGVKPAAVQTGSLTPADFASRYHLSPLYAKGATGAGATIGVVTLASLNPADPEYFWSNVLGISTLSDRITLDNVDGGSGPVSLVAGSNETTLDVEQSGALAPQAKIVVYQAPNTDFGFVDAFYTAASQNIADSVSASWGLSETAVDAAVVSGEESATYEIAFNDAFLEMAAQGQSAFVSSADFGAYTPIGDIGTTNRAPEVPGSSPYVTAAGATTLPGTIPLTATDSATISAERTWGWDWWWPHYADFGLSSEFAAAQAEPLGSGGGFSNVEPTPPYQQGVRGVHNFSAVEYLTPIDDQSVDGLTLPTQWSFNPTPSVTQGFGFGRATPDVSADGDPYTGYLLYFSGFSGNPLEAGWGGTSFVAPQLNGSTALIDSLLGHRVGFWNPDIYRWATSGHDPFSPLDTAGTSNDNLYYTGTPGNVYNVGSGLGTPNLARIARDFARLG